MNKGKKIGISLILLSLFLVIVGTAFASNTLQINNPAGAGIWVDGVNKGVTPLTMTDLSDGTHYVQAYLTPGPSYWQNYVETPNGSNTVMDLPYVTFTVTSDPAGARVYMKDNSEFMGLSPVTYNYLVPDFTNLYTYKLMVKNFAYFDNITYIPVRAGDAKTYNAVMKRVDSTGGFALTTNVASATWKLTKPGHPTYQGTTNGAGSGGNPRVDLGVYTLTVSKTGYVTQVSTVDVASPNSVDANGNIVYNYTAVTVNLVQTGSLSVVTTPTGAYLYVDNVLKGATPRIVTGLAPGDHDVKLTKTGYQIYTTVANIVSGQTTNLNVTMTPL